jgi:hypothetical protein
VTVRRLISILAAVAAGWWLASRPPQRSDEELIRALLADGARAAEEQRVADAVAVLSESFRGRSPGGAVAEKRDVKRLIAAQVIGRTWLAIKVASCGVTVEGEGARSTLDLVLSRGGAGRSLADLLPGEARALRIQARLTREPDGWRVVEASWTDISLAEALAGGAATAR